MKRKHLLKSSAALLLAFGIAAAPLAPIVPLAPIIPLAPAVSLTAAAVYNSNANIDDFVQWDYSKYKANKVSHEGWTAITDPSQFTGMRSGKYYLNCPGGICDLSPLHNNETFGDITIDLNGQILKNSQLLSLGTGSTFTIIDSGYNKATHRFSLDSKGYMVYDENGDIKLKGGCILTFPITSDDDVTDLMFSDDTEYTFNMYGGNIVTRNKGGNYIIADRINVYGGNILGGAALEAIKELYMENTLIAYKSYITVAKNAKGEIKNCEFHDNNASIQYHSVKSDLKVSNCNFWNNERGVGDYDRGTGSNVLITDCTFTDCNYAFTNGIGNPEGTMLVKDSVIKNCSEIAFSAGLLTLEGCEAYDNENGIRSSAGTLVLNDTVIRDGGGITGDIKKLTLNDSVIDNINGNGIHITDAKAINQLVGGIIEMSGSTISNCTGSGIANDTVHAEITISNSSFNSNVNNGITIKSGKNVLIENSTISDNDSSGFDIHGTNINIVGSTISRNNGGGTVFSYDLTTIKDCDVISNCAEDGVGGLYLRSTADYSIENCRIEGNTSKESAGGVQCTEGTGTIIDTVIRNNSTTDDCTSAGGLSLSFTNVKASGLIVENNTIKSQTMPSSSSAGIRTNNDVCLELDGTEKPCVITGNTTYYPEKLFDVCAGIRYKYGSKLKVSGSVTITGNTINSGKTIKEANVFVDDIFIEVDKKNALSEDSLIGVTVGTNTLKNCGSGYQQVTMPTTDDQMTRFVSDKGYNVDMLVIEEAGGSCVVFKGNHNWGEWEESGDKLVRTCKLNSAHTESKDIAKYSVSVWAAPMRTGKITASTYEAKAGKKVTLTATPYKNYAFDSWTVVKGDITIDENNSFIMPAGDVEIAANFVYDGPESHTVSVWAAPSRSGHVQASADEAEAGEIVTLTARPYDGYRFVKWTVVAGDVTIDENNSFVMPDERVEIMAEFEYVSPTKHTISTWADTPRTGKVNVSAEEAAAGEKITLTPVPYQNYKFKEWNVVTENVTIDENNTFVMPDENVEIVAVFEYAPEKHTISAWADPMRTGKVEVSAKEAAAGEKVTLTPVPYQNYKFKEWNVVTENVTIDENNSFVMPDENVEIVAVFEYAGATVSLLGDANCDGKVTIADAAAVLQYLGNKDRYPLTEQGRKNADCDGTAGITTADAIAIQKYVSGIIEKLG